MARLRSLSKINQAQKDKHLRIPFSKLVSLKLRVEEWVPEAGNNNREEEGRERLDY